MFDAKGYPLYRRRDDGHVIRKCDIEIDNMYVVLTMLSASTIQCTYQCRVV